jgi:chemotaxis protein methyltransferase CheR
MLLSEAGWFDRVPIEVLGSDASPLAIDRARRGEYTQRSFRNLAPAMREKYFVEHEGHWRVIPTLQRRVAYDVVNLIADDEVARHAGAPIIFCRNVFIYFSDQSIRRARGLFERSMPAPAYLCVAAAESLLSRTTAFELQEIGGAFVYVKNANAAQRLAATPGVENGS